MLRGDIFILKAVSFLISQINDPLDARRDKYLSCTAAKNIRLRCGSQDIVQPFGEFVSIHL